MPTPAYTFQVDTSPAITQTRQQIVDAARNNDLAIRDAITIGRATGWTKSVSGGTAEEPGVILQAKGSERLRATITWSGGYIIAIAWDWSNDSGSTYSVIFTETATYDGSGNTTAGTHSSMLSWLWEWIGKLKALRTLYNAHVVATGTAVHGLGSISTQSAANVVITGGFADSVVIGNTTRQIGTFRQAREQHLSIAFVSGGTTNLDWAQAGSHDVTATGTGVTTMGFTNLPPAGIAASIVLDLTNGGLRTWTWPIGVDWASGTAPTLTSAGRDILTFYTRDGGVIVHGTMASKDSR